MQKPSVKLVAPLRPIRTEADYESALAEIEELFAAEADTPEGDRLEVLTTLVEAYEHKHHPIQPRGHLRQRGEGHHRRMRLYVAQYVICIEEQWFDREDPEVPKRSEKTYNIESYLFAADDSEHAYALAVDWLDGHEDAHHDGFGDLTQCYAVGLHNIEDIDLDLDKLLEEVTGVYGADVGRYVPAVGNADCMPVIREKADLDIFRKFES